MTLQDSPGPSRSLLKHPGVPGGVLELLQKIIEVFEGVRDALESSLNFFKTFRPGTTLGFTTVLRPNVQVPKYFRGLLGSFKTFQKALN